MSTIRDAVNACDPSKETELIIKEQLETLSQLANAQNNIDSAAIEMALKDGKINDDLTVPITKVLGKYNETHVVTTQKADVIVNRLSGSIKSFFNPSAEGILTGVAGILGTALDALMGAGQGMEAKKSMYSVVVEYPAIIRFDFAMWVRNTRATGIMERCKNAVSIVAYKSAVDITKLDFATFLAIYSPVLNKAFGSDQTKIKELIAEAKDVYGMLADDKRMRVARPVSEAELEYFPHEMQFSIDPPLMP